MMGHTAQVFRKGSFHLLLLLLRQSFHAADKQEKRFLLQFRGIPVTKPLHIPEWLARINWHPKHIPLRFIEPIIRNRPLLAVSNIQECHLIVRRE